MFAKQRRYGFYVGVVWEKQTWLTWLELRPIVMVLVPAPPAMALFDRPTTQKDPS